MFDDYWLEQRYAAALHTCKGEASRECPGCREDIKWPEESSSERR